jgi:glycolate oxidase iron-sulfur subunit
VKCGFCLPHCPTYDAFRDESESPRGRIALIQGLLRGQLEASPRLVGHLDHCLLCRNCEPVCPSQVEYGEIMDAARGHLRDKAPPGWLLGTITDRGRLAVLGSLIAPLQRAGALRLIPRRWRRMAGWLGRGRARDKGTVTTGTAAPDEVRGTVVLFHGCVSAEVDKGAIAAARRLLTHLGYVVVSAEASLCCGAIHRHAGHADEAGIRLVRVRDWLAGQPADAVLSIATGCGAQLIEKGGLGVPVRDVGAFLGAVAWPQSLLDAMPAQAVLLHQPCTLRNGMHQHRAVADLLDRFEGLRVELLDEGCCGGAGMHLVHYPVLASRLAGSLVARVRDAGADVLLTSNTGCSLHLTDELEAAGLNLSVRHPVEFIAEQLGI